VAEGEKLNKRIRTLAHSIDGSWKKLKDLIIQAKAREIHTDLGFKLWPDYIADVTRTEMPNIARSVEQRRQVVALLAGEGMSQRTIADAVGVSQSTVRDDVAEVSSFYSPDPARPLLPTDDRDAQHVVVTITREEPATDYRQAGLEELAEENGRIDAAKARVTGRDGKQYPAKPKAKPKPKPKSPWPQIPDIGKLRSDTLTLERRLDEFFIGPESRRRVTSKLKPIDPLRDEFTFSLHDLEAAVEAHAFLGRAVEKMKVIAAAAYANPTHQAPQQHSEGADINDRHVQGRS
jgi:hypothetical protein